MTLIVVFLLPMESCLCLQEGNPHRSGSMTRVVGFREDVLEHNGDAREHRGDFAHRDSETFSEDGNELANMQEFSRQKMRRRQSVSAESKPFCFLVKN